MNYSVLSFMSFYLLVDSGLRRVAQMALININAEHLAVPDQEYQVDIEIQTKLYSAIIKDLSSVGEDVKISVTSKAMKFEADGEAGRVENVFPRGQGSFQTSLWSFNTSDGLAIVEQSFGVRFLSGFAKACPLSESVSLIRDC